MWKVYLEDRPWDLRCYLHLVRQREGHLDVVKPFEMTTIPHGGMIVEPSMGVLGDTSREESVAFLRAVMDQAWELGIRPTKFQDHTNELKALRDHLQDMRKLAKVAP